MNPFEGKRIRSCTDTASNKRWFSAVDICAAITGKDYQKARNYWKWLKAKIKRQKNEIEYVTYQIKMEAADGKLRLTDVLDGEAVINIINSCPCPKAKPVKLWLEGLIANGKNAAGQIADAAKKTVCKTGNLLYIITQTVIYDRKTHGPQNDDSPSLLCKIPESDAGKNLYMKPRILAA